LVKIYLKRSISPLWGCVYIKPTLVYIEII